MGVLFLFATLFALSLAYHDLNGSPIRLDNLPTVHTTQLLAQFKFPSLKRTTSIEQFFRMSGIGFLCSDETHDFLVKPTIQDDDTISVDGEISHIQPEITYQGYSMSDPKTSISFTFQESEGGQLKPFGMVFWSTGRQFFLTMDSKKGMVMVEVGKNNCEGFTSPVASSEDVEQAKRSLESVQAAPIRVIETCIESDSEYYKYSKGNKKNATKYIDAVLAAVNTIFERDLRLRMKRVSYNLYATRKAQVAGDLYQLKKYIASSDSKGKCDIAIVLQGGSNNKGGLAFLSGVCGEYRTGQIGSTGTFGTNEWDASADVIVMAHEVGHLLGSGHTHESGQYGYSPLIDRCGLGGAFPSNGGGSIMSYCHTVPKSDGWHGIAWSFGAPKKYGLRSERVEALIQKMSGNAWCLSVADPSRKRAPAPTKAPKAPESPAPKAPSSSTVLFSQGDSCILNKGVPSTTFSDANRGVRAVDDFIVPAGSTFRLTTIRAAGEFHGKVPSDFGVAVSILNRQKTRCKIFVEPSDVQFVNGVLTLNVTNDDCHLVGGYVAGKEIVPSTERFYLTISPIINFTETKTFFYWSFSTTKNGEHYSWRDRLDLLKKGCTSWSKTCGLLGDGSDLCFSIYGVESKTLPSDIMHIGQFSLSNDGDGEIGSDSVEPGPFIQSKSNFRQDLSIQMSSTSTQIDTKVGARTSNVGSMDGTPTWVIPVGVILCLLLALIALLIGFFVYKRATAQPPMETV